MSAAHDCEVRAFVLSRVAFGEADLIVHLFTDTFGKISALARGARQSQKRFAGALEPLHTVRLRVVEKPRAELFTLKEGTLDKPRLGLTTRLELLEAAGRALHWVKKTAPPRTPEPEVWHALEHFLDRMNDAPDTNVESQLTAFGFRLIDGLGWALEMTRCVSCGKPCPLGQAAWVHPERGGLVCRNCGGGPVLVPGAVRIELLEVMRTGAPPPSPESGMLGLKLIERALAAHSGVDQSSSRG